MRPLTAPRLTGGVIDAVDGRNPATRPVQTPVSGSFCKNANRSYQFEGGAGGGGKLEIAS